MQCSVVLYGDTGAVPQVVTLVLAKANKSVIQPDAFLPICHLVDKPEVGKLNFTVCISGPLHYFSNVSMVRQLVEWIEVNSLFGADHFVLYNHSGNGQILQPYVDYYSMLGRVELIQWDLAALGINDPKTDVYYYAQILQQNDCLFRNMFRTKYIAFLDVDEFIVPRGQHSSWSDLVSTCEDAAQYLVRCLIFRRNLPSDEQAISDYDLLTLVKTKAENRIFPAGIRTKYIVNPLYILSVTVHHVHKFMSSISRNKSRTCTVRPEVALLHHYRNCSHWGKQGWNVDAFMHKHRQAILQRVSKTHRMVDGV